MTDIKEVGDEDQQLRDMKESAEATSLPAPDVPQPHERSQEVPSSTSSIRLKKVDLQYKLPARMNYGNQTIEIVVQSITLLENGQVHSVQSLDRHGVQISHSSREEQGIVKNPMHPVPCSSRGMINDKLGVHFQGAHQIRITSKDGRHIKYDNNVPTYVFRSKEDCYEFQGQLLQKIVVFSGDIQLMTEDGKALCKRSFIQIVIDAARQRRSILYFQNGMVDMVDVITMRDCEVWNGAMSPHKTNATTFRRKKDRPSGPPSPAPGPQPFREPKCGSDALSDTLFEGAKAMKVTLGPPLGPLDQHFRRAPAPNEWVIEQDKHFEVAFTSTEDCLEFRKKMMLKLDHELPPRMQIRFKNPNPQRPSRSVFWYQGRPIPMSSLTFPKPFSSSPEFQYEWQGTGQTLKQVQEAVEDYMRRHLTISSYLTTSDGANVPTSRKSLNIHVHWRIGQFMSDQFGVAKIDIGSVIVVVGTIKQAQATTIDEYCSGMWPKTSYTVLSAVRALHDDRKTTAEADNTTDFPDLVIVEGTIEEIVEVAQQLIFLGSAFATSTTGKIEYSHGKIALSDSKGCHITFGKCEPPILETCCWQNLFVNPVIVDNFPIERRGEFEGMIGLEIPVRMMSALGGAVHQVEFGGGIVIKGFSAMFVPVKRVGDYVQWHYIYNEDGSRLPYGEADKHCPGRLLMNHKEVASTRAILGWWGKVATRLGSADINYDRICWTDLKEPSRSVAFSGGSFGFQMFGTGQLNFSIGPKDTRLHISQPGPYQRIIEHASNTPVVLFDTEKSDRRGWLVPASSVLAHVAQTKHARTKFSVDGRVARIQPTDPELDVGDGAKKMLLENAATILIRDPWDQSSFDFRDLVLGIWSLLEILMDQDYKREASPDVRLYTTGRRKIQGWEFMDLVTERSSIRMKEVGLRKSCSNWIDLAYDINAVVLLASGLEDLIIPREYTDSGLCQTWTTVPKQKDYLTVGVPLLKTLIEQAGSPKYLTSTHLQWHRGPMLFENCTAICQESGSTCICDRVQQILPDSLLTLGEINPPGPLPPQGAVIFGQSTHAFKKLIRPIWPAEPSKVTFNLLVNLGLFRPTTLRSASKSDAESSDFPTTSSKGKGIQHDRTTVTSDETEVD